MNIESQLQAALKLHQAGDYQLAKQNYEKVLINDPQNVDAIHLLGVIAQQNGDPKEAVRQISRAIAINPKVPLFYSNLGNAYRDLGLFDDAEKSYLTSLQLSPHFTDAMINLSALYIQIDKFEKAFIWSDQALHQGKNAFALCFRGTSRKNLGQLEAARDDLEEALQLDPKLAQAWTNLGNCLRDLYDYEGALKAHDKAVHFQPTLADAWNNRGYVLKQMGRPEEALASYDKAIALKKDFYGAFFNKSMILLHQGKWREGLELYEYRRKLKNAFRINLSIPEWNREPLKDKRILIYGEQGLGDTFQFIRFIELLVERGAKVSMAALPGLHLLLSSWAKDKIRLVNLEPREADYDFQSSLMSLPYKLEIDSSHTKPQPAYLFVDQSRIDFWRERLKNGSHKKVGICWQGNPKFPEDRLRSIPLQAFESLLSDRQTQFFSLQKGFGSEQILESRFRDRIIDFTSDFDRDGHQFIDVGALMMNLDLIISIDSAIAHLAGALGRPTRILLPKVSDWRWGYEGDDRIWYESVKLIRQTQSQNWQSAISQIDF